jgi:predicted transcriptional regulator
LLNAFAKQLYISTSQQLVEEGLIMFDENEDARLTDKGKKRVAKMLDKLSPGQEVMLQLAFAEAHGMSVSMD